MPTQLTSKITPETEATKEFYAAINRNDIAAAAAFFDLDVVRIEPEGFPTSGTYRGRAEVQVHLANGRGTWAEGTCEPEKLIVAGDKVVVFLYVHVRLHGKTDWIEGRFADGLTFRNGKITEFHTFAKRQDALKWAGVESSDVNG